MDLYSEVVDPVPIEQDDEVADSVIKEAADGTLASSSAQVVEDRLKRRAKRPSKYLMKHLTGNSSPTAAGQSSPGRGDGAGSSSGLVNGVRTAKNMRRPRNGHGRGLPKKGIFLQ